MDTKKTFCLDGDLFNRSIDYLQHTIKKEFKFYKKIIN